MTIKVTIGTSERNIDDIGPNWITDQINRRRKDGVQICVRISINTPNLNLSLATPGCAKSAGGGRAPNPQEKEVFDMWDKFNLNTQDFSPGNLVAFLKQLV